MRLSLKDMGLLIVTILSYVYLAYFSDRNVPTTILVPVCLLFVAYATVVLQKINPDNRNHFINILSIAIIGRLIFVLADPTLSDDYYRFFWDAKLLNSGQNPFGSLPSEIVSIFTTEGNAQEVLGKMNSPNYFTVYPAVLQYVFGFAFWLSNGIVYDFVIWLRWIYLIFDLGTIYILLQLLKVLKLSPYYVLVFALNPLVIVEGVGNLHPESIMLFFLCTGLYFLITNKYLIAGLFLGLSISTKLIPLILLPSIWNYVGSRRFLLVLLGTAPLILLLHIPFISFEALSNIFESISLYFNSFEFNASLYFLLSAFFNAIIGYNPIHIIGPVLAAITFILIVYLSFRPNKTEANDLLQQWVFIFTVYYFLATTVHPWYIMPLIMFTVITQSYLYPILWSALIFLSYIQYSGGGYEFKPVVVAIEYVLLLVTILYEWRHKRTELVQKG